MFPRAVARALCLLPLVIPFTPLQTVQGAAASSHVAKPAPATHQPLRTSLSAYNTFGLTREVFGYAYLGSLSDPNVGYGTWDFNLLSTVAVFAIRVNFDGVLVADSSWSVWDSSTLTNLVSVAHLHGVKVVPSLVPLYGSSDHIDFCDTLYNADTTVGQIVNQVKLKGVDGVNIDYEGQNFPCTNNNPALNTSSQNLMVQFAQKMRAGLDAYKPGLFLSIASYSGSASANDGFFNIPALNPYTDAFFVMAYDMDEANQGSPPLQNCPRFCMAPISPLTNYFWNDTNSMAQYSAAVGPGKVILGQPYYGRAACVSTVGSNAVSTTPIVTPTYLNASAVINSPDVRPGTYSINRDAADVTGVDRWDAWYDNALGCWREMYWQDVTTLSNRYDMINQQNLRGLGIWTLQYGGGAPELWNAIQSHFVACMNAAVTPNPAPPQLSGTQFTLTASSTACANPRYAFWMLPPGGTWRLVQPYSTNAVYKWDTSGYQPGTYRFSVWALDRNSRGPNGTGGNTYDSFSAMDFVLTTSPCTAMTAASAPATAAIGTTVAITGTATGCPNASYQFWIQPPGGGWSIAQAYSTKPSFDWKTSGWPAGAYRFSVWARDNSSLGTGGSAPYTYDAFAGLQYTLGTPSCSALSVATDPANSAYRASAVSVTGTANGCPTPLYQFWLLPPGGSWTVVQGYSTSPTFNWNTSGLPVGSYRFSVWSRDAASPNSYDSFMAFPYTITSAPCTGMSATTTPSGTAVRGTTVTVTGTATGCPNPMYEFWMLAPGGSWTMVQGYTTTPTFTWNSTNWPAGTYRFSVWARDASSYGTNVSGGASYDAFSAATFTLT